VATDQPYQEALPLLPLAGTNRKSAWANQPANPAKASLLTNAPSGGEGLENPFNPDRLKFNQRPPFA